MASVGVQSAPGLPVAPQVQPVHSAPSYKPHDVLTTLYYVSYCSTTRATAGPNQSV
jgi:hypothetical protein